MLTLLYSLIIINNDDTQPNELQVRDTKPKEVEGASGSDKAGEHDQGEQPSALLNTTSDSPLLRRSTRLNAGYNSNPFNEPRSAVKQEVRVDSQLSR